MSPSDANGMRPSDEKGPTEFRVWAPRAQRMTLQLDGTRHPMTAEAGGWWSATASGRDYGYLIDDAEAPRADPRSRWQPDGVHGLSRVFDPGAHEWQDGAWTGRQLALTGARWSGEAPLEQALAGPFGVALLVKASA
jgi:1,4-alpha-glucan branching enzyme